MIVFDKAESVSPFVVMSMEEYEKLALGRAEVRGLTENEFVDKINRDVAIWKSDNEYTKELAEDYRKNKDFTNRDDDYCDAEDEDDDWDDEDEIREIYKEDFSSPGLKEMGKNLQKKDSFRRGWRIPSDRKKAADEVVGEEEDRQYLEDVPF